MSKRERHHSVAKMSPNFEAEIAPQSLASRCDGFVRAQRTSKLAAVTVLCARGGGFSRAVGQAAHPHTHAHGRRTDIQTDRQADRQTVRHTDIQNQANVAVLVKTKQHQHANQFKDTLKCLDNSAKA